MMEPVDNSGKGGQAVSIVRMYEDPGPAGKVCSSVRRVHYACWLYACTNGLHEFTNLSVRQICCD